MATARGDAIDFAKPRQPEGMARRGSTPKAPPRAACIVVHGSMTSRTRPSLPRAAERHIRAALVDSTALRHRARGFGPCRRRRERRPDRRRRARPTEGRARRQGPYGLQDERVFRSGPAPRHDARSRASNPARWRHSRRVDEAPTAREGHDPPRRLPRSYRGAATEGLRSPKTIRQPRSSRAHALHVRCRPRGGEARKVATPDASLVFRNELPSVAAVGRRSRSRPAWRERADRTNGAARLARRWEREAVRRDARENRHWVEPSNAGLP